MNFKNYYKILQYTFIIYQVNDTLNTTGDKHYSVYLFLTEKTMFHIYFLKGKMQFKYVLNSETIPNI